MDGSVNCGIQLKSGSSPVARFASVRVSLFFLCFFVLRLPNAGMWVGIGSRLASPKPIGEGRSLGEGAPNVGGFVRCIIPHGRDGG